MATLAFAIAAASLGAMLFFSAVVAPSLFRTLAADDAGRFLRTLFPRYFLVNGLAACAAALCAGGTAAGASLLLAGLLLLGLRLFAVPAINAARDAMQAGVPGAERRFHRLHRTAVAVNVTEMGLLLLALAALPGAT